MYDIAMLINMKYLLEIRRAQGGNDFLDFDTLSWIFLPFVLNKLDLLEIELPNYAKYFKSPIFFVIFFCSSRLKPLPFDLCARLIQNQSKISDDHDFHIV